MNKKQSLKFFLKLHFGNHGLYGFWGLHFCFLEEFLCASKSLWSAQKRKEFQRTSKSLWSAQKRKEFQRTSKSFNLSEKRKEFQRTSKSFNLSEKRKEFQRTSKSLWKQKWRPQKPYRPRFPKWSFKKNFRDCVFHLKQSKCGAGSWIYKI